MNEILIIANAKLARRNKDNDFTGINTFAGIKNNVLTKSTNYTLTDLDNVVVFTSTATATLPEATGTGQMYRIICRSGTTTIDGNGSDTVKGELTQTLSEGEDIILSDTATGKWE
jgi:hypothetical protein